MKISELVVRLDRIREQRGDLVVYVGTRYAISEACGIEFDRYDPEEGLAVLIEGEEDE